MEAVRRALHRTQLGLPVRREPLGRSGAGQRRQVRPEEDQNRRVRQDVAHQEVPTVRVLDLVLQARGHAQSD